MTPCIDQQRALIRAALSEHRMTSAEFARRVGRSEHFVARVLAGLTDTSDIESWAFVLGFAFKVDMVPLSKVTHSDEGQVRP